MNYRDDLDDLKLNSHLENNEDDWPATSRRYPTGSTAYKKTFTDHKRSSYSDTDHLDLSPEHRSKSYEKSSGREDELNRAPLDKKYDLYNSTNYKDSFNDNYKETSFKDAGFKEVSYKDATYKDSAYKDSAYKDSSYKDSSYKDSSYKDSYKDPYKDPYKDANYKDSFKETSYKENELSKAPDRKYNDLDKKFSSASEHSAVEYRNPERNFDRNLDFDFGDEKKPLGKRPSNPYDAGKTSEMRKLDYRRSSELRKSIDKDKFDLLDSQLESGGKITIDTSKDRYRSSLDSADRSKGRFNADKFNPDKFNPDKYNADKFNLDDYFPNSDTDAGAREKSLGAYRKNSDYDRYSSDSLTNAVKGKSYEKSLYDKYANRTLERTLDKQYDFGDGILDEIRRLELKEEVRKNEIMSELKNAENILKHQNNHKFLHKTDSLDNQIKLPSNLAKTSSELMCFSLFV